MAFSSRFRVFKKPLRVHLNRMKDMVLACVVLHNMLRAKRGAGGRVDRDLEDEVIPCVFLDGDAAGGHDRTPNSAKQQRDYLKDWFNGAAAVAWQDDKV